MTNNSGGNNKLAAKEEKTETKRATKSHSIQ